MNWQSLSITRKIYLCLGILITAYVTSIGFLIYEHHIEQERLEAIANRYFPASLLSQSANNSFGQLIKSYEDAVTIGEPSILQNTDDLNDAILADITKLSVLVPTPAELSALKELSKHLQEYSGNARSHYGVMASGRNVPIVVVQELATKRARLKKLFEVNADKYSVLLKTEISNIDAHSRKVLWISVVSFLILAVPTLVLVTVILANIARKLNATVDRIRHVALGKGSIKTRLEETLGKGDTDRISSSSVQTDEMNLLEQSFDQMAIELRSSFNQQDALFDEAIAAEKALKESERKFRVVFDHSPAIIVLATVSDGIICEVNQTCVESLGFEKDELLGKSAFEVGLSADNHSRAIFADTLQRQGYIHEMAAMLKSKDGTEHDVLISAELVEIDGIKYSLNVVQDITERKQMEEQLLQHQKLESIGLLVGGIAHDFNNMLAPIFIYAEMIRKKFPEDDATHKRAASILSAAGKSKNLIKQLLCFSSKQKLDKQIHDLNDIINAFSEILQRTIRESICINKNLCSDPCPVKIDNTQIEQILLNLAVNAQDAIGTNGDLTIETGRVFLDDEYCQIHPRANPGQYVMMAFTDSGCGMDNSVLSRIFEPFYTTKGVGFGTGLGLSTVFGIVKQHDGYIDVMSKPGRGTTFRIYLPLSDTTDLQDGSSEANYKGHAKAAKHATILVVEDNEMVMDMTCELLESNGYTVVSAHQPEEAINIARNHPGGVDLLLTDVVMPQMNGPELHSRLKEFMQDLPVLYMSGYVGGVTVHDGALTENIDYIAKPFTADKLLTQVSKAIG